MHNEKEMVNSPAHYNTGKIEVIEAIDDWSLDFYEGNIVKYVSRSKFKGKRIEDLKKAQWYLNRLINKLDNSLSKYETEVKLMKKYNKNIKQTT